MIDQIDLLLNEPRRVLTNLVMGLSLPQVFLAKSQEPTVQIVPLTPFTADGKQVAAEVLADCVRDLFDAATIERLSADGKVMTIEYGVRGEEPKKTEIKLADKTTVEFVRTEKEEDRKLAVGYHVTVWLQEGSKDTADVVQALKPGERGR